MLLWRLLIVNSMFGQFLLKVLLNLLITAKISRSVSFPCLCKLQIKIDLEIQFFYLRISKIEQSLLCRLSV